MAKHRRLIIDREEVERLMLDQSIPSIVELAHHANLAYFGLVRTLNGSGWSHKTLGRLAHVLKPDEIGSLLKWAN
jgi:hypothetical protein|tara:strand:- start:1770 stop:1994 length:225 start_codon:yes stop_codon:yes gene_type:complete